MLLFRCEFLLLPVLSARADISKWHNYVSFKWLKRKKCRFGVQAIQRIKYTVALQMFSEITQSCHDSNHKITLQSNISIVKDGSYPIGSVELGLWPSSWSLQILIAGLYKNVPFIFWNTIESFWRRNLHISQILHNQWRSRIPLASLECTRD